MTHRTIAAIAALAILAGCASADSATATDAAPAQPATPRTIKDFLETHADDLARGIDDPDVIVDWAYVTALIESWDTVRSRPIRGWFDGNLVLTADERHEIGSRLREALPRKHAAAVIPAIGVLARLGEASGTGFRNAVLRAWPDMDESMHQYLLRGSWDAVRCPEFEPLLRAAIRERNEPGRDRPPTPWHVAYTPTLALLRMTDLQPQEARAIILADIRRDQPLFGGMALTALPDEQLEEVEAQFRRPHEELLHWSFDLQKHGPLAERYGGADALATALALLDRRERIHDPRLIRIVMSHDRDEGFVRLEAAMRTRTRKPWRRPGVVLRAVLADDGIEQRDLWADDAAEFVRRYLDDPDEEVRRNAELLLEAHARAAEEAAE